MNLFSHFTESKHVDNSPVNTFRVLFNTYFDYDYVINITNDHYVDVTNSLITSDDN